MSQRIGARPWLAHGQQDYAQVLVSRAAAGDVEKAVELLEASLSTARALGMINVADRAAPLLAELCGTPLG